MKLPALKDFKIGRDSAAATEQAKIADTRARELREKSTKLQNEWTSLCARYSQIADAIEHACAVHSELQVTADGGFEQALRASFDWGGDANKSKHIAIEISKAAGAAPVIAKMIENMRAELLAHANEMRLFARENALPAECTKDLADA